MKPNENPRGGKKLGGEGGLEGERESNRGQRVGFLRQAWRAFQPVTPACSGRQGRDGTRRVIRAMGTALSKELTRARQRVGEFRVGSWESVLFLLATIERQ